MQDIILQAIEDFSDIAKITYSSGILDIEAEDEIDTIFNEFMNYCIALHNEF